MTAFIDTNVLVRNLTGDPPGVNKVASFDRSLDRITTIERIEPTRP